MKHILLLFIATVVSILIYAFPDLEISIRIYSFFLEIIFILIFYLFELTSKIKKLNTTNENLENIRKELATQCNEKNAEIDCYKNFISTVGGRIDTDNRRYLKSTLKDISTIYYTFINRRRLDNE